jgi:hypothetical protein
VHLFVKAAVIVRKNVIQGRALYLRKEEIN